MCDRLTMGYVCRLLHDLTKLLYLTVKMGSLLIVNRFFVGVSFKRLGNAGGHSIGWL